MKSKILLWVSFVVLVCFGCEKGDTGPAGPQGNIGQEGPQGPQGNANVIGTAPLTITSSDWTWTSGFYITNLNVPEISQDIVDKGLVQVFVKYGNNSWSPLPDINGINSTTFLFSLSQVTLYNSNSDFTIPTLPAFSTFRVVVISSLRIRENPAIDWNNYNQVKRVLGLTD